MRWLLILLVLAAIAGGAWYVFRSDGLLQQVTEERVRTALLNNRVPEPMANCMAPRLVDKLTIQQLRKLERLAPEEGERKIPLSVGDAMARLRRVDDREAVETLVIVAGGCGFDMMLRRL